MVEVDFVFLGFGSLVMRLQGESFMGWSSLLRSSLAILPEKGSDPFNYLFETVAIFTSI